MADLELRLVNAFATNLVQLLNDIIDNYDLGDKSPKVVGLRIAVENDYGTVSIMEKFSQIVLPFKDRIVSRDLNFFLSDDFYNSSVVKSLGSNEEVNSYRVLFEANKNSNATEIEAFFKYFDRLIKCCENYNKLKLQNK